MRTHHALGLLVTCIVMAGCPAPPGALEAHVPRFNVAADGDGNELTVSTADETTLIDVHSQSGIGSATVELVSGAPPENIVLRLHLQGLEEFRLSYAGTVVAASVASGDMGSIVESAISSEGGQQSITPDSPLWLDIRLVSSQATSDSPLDQGHFEITLPKDLLQEGRRSFSIRWIDFYR